MIGLKSNQKRLLKHAEYAFEKYAGQADEYTTEEKNRGRYEKRTYQLLLVEDLDLSINAGVGFSNT